MRPFARVVCALAEHQQNNSERHNKCECAGSLRNDFTCRNLSSFFMATSSDTIVGLADTQLAEMLDGSNLLALNWKFVLANSI